MQTLPVPLLLVRCLRNDAKLLGPSTIHSMSPARRRSKSSSTALLSFDEAAALVAVHAAKVARIRPGPRSLGIERARLSETFGRVLAEPLRADADQPPFARSTRDGFACRAAEASTHRPLAVAGSTRAGQSPSGPLPRGAAWEIMTGAPVPSGADAVVMLEHVERSAPPSARPSASCRRAPSGKAKTSWPAALRRAKATNFFPPAP